MSLPHLDPRALAPSLFSRPLGDIAVSFEFFPPKTATMEDKLWAAIQELAPLSPDFVSITYGAGGSTRERTHRTVERILKETPLTPAAHLTCVDHSRDEIERIARAYRDLGVRHLVALRGDPPERGARYRPHPDGYAYAADLVAGLKRIADFEISVAAYPERHPESPTLAADLENLKRKEDAGASRAITQFFFEADTFFRFLDHARAFGITMEIVPGILPVTSVAQVRRFAAFCGAQVPEWMDRLFEGLDDRPQTRALIAATVAGELCSRLHAGGVRHFHFYTLNRAPLTYAICHLLGLRPAGTGAGTDSADDAGRENAA